MDLLSKIIATRKRRVNAAKEVMRLNEVRELANSARANSESHRLATALLDKRRTNIIAEFKRRSPSKGDIDPTADAATVARLYQCGGAAAISVLTEQDYFAGSLDDLRTIRETVSLPILRKDFIFEEYQVYESAAAGADALLLIVAALDDQTLITLRRLTEDELGMDALVEVHTREELKRAVDCGARIIGVNNRDLRTFGVSVATSAQLARFAPSEAILVSESGLNPEEVQKLRVVGYKGFLVGEALMRADDPSQMLSEFIEGRTKLKRYYPKWPLVKICGITNIEDAKAAIEAGADMLGFNFYRKSPRYIEPKTARAIIDAMSANFGTEKQTVMMIGVFVNESVEAIHKAVNEAGLDGVQLHGDETIELCKQFKALAPDKFLIKVIAARADLNFESLHDHPANAIMLDAFDADLRGGTGRVADWRIAREIAKTVRPVYLAGGLSPENIADAIAAVQPQGVDACSSLESTPGRKDAARLAQFISAAHAACAANEA